MFLKFSVIFKNHLGRKSFKKSYYPNTENTLYLRLRWLIPQKVSKIPKQLFFVKTYFQTRPNQATEFLILQFGLGYIIYATQADKNELSLNNKNEVIASYPFFLISLVVNLLNSVST